MMMTLKIGAVALPLLAALDIDQAYEPIGGEAILRTLSGTGIRQMTWQRSRITTSGSGWLPAGLDTLDTSAQMVLACVIPRGVPAVFATRQATLPAARRSDAGHLPWGIAIMPDGAAVATAAVLAGNVATLTAVAGAVAYQAMYLPQLTVWAMRPTDGGNRGDTSYRWQIVCEEV